MPSPPHRVFLIAKSQISRTSFLLLMSEIYSSRFLWNIIQSNSMQYNSILFPVILYNYSVRHTHFKIFFMKKKNPVIFLLHIFPLSFNKYHVFIHFSSSDTECKYLDWILLWKLRINLTMLIENHYQRAQVSTLCISKCLFKNIIQILCRC